VSASGSVRVTERSVGQGRVQVVDPEDGLGCIPATLELPIPEDLQKAIDEHRRDNDGQSRDSGS